MPKRRKLWLWILLLIVLLLASFLFFCWRYPSESFGDRENERWRYALRSDARLAGLDKARRADVKAWEERYRLLMDALTAEDGHGGDHGLHHRTKPEREAELWTHLKSLPAYRAAPAILLASIDDVYLGYHGNGWWGVWWHWPYLNCTRAEELADRLARDHPAFEEEALWTRIYCSRVKGWSESERTGGYPSPDPSAPSQDRWTSDAAKVTALCQELQRKYPNGKYASMAAALLSGKQLLLELPGHPVWGRVRSDGSGRSFTVKSYEGPDFIIERVR